MIRVRKAAQLASALVVIFAVGSREADAEVTTNTPEWVGHKRDLCVCFEPGASDAFKLAARAAGGKWNAANTGWTFKFDECNPPCDVRISDGGGAAGFPGIPYGTAGNSIGTGTSAGTTGFLISIRAGLTGASLDKALMHEMGHAMRLAHGSNGTVMARDIAHVSSTVQDEDKKEAKASAADPACPMNASTYLLRGVANQNLNFTAAPGSGITFASVTSVQVVSLLGSDVTYTVDHWTSSAIYVIASVSATAPHNEVQRTTLTYADQTVAAYTGIIFIADDPIGMNVLPHAVAGSNQTVTVGNDVTLNASSSYHDDPDLTSKMTAVWIVDGNTWSISDVLVLTLGLGTHSATLWVQDTYGRTASDSITITVVP